MKNDLGNSNHLFYRRHEPPVESVEKPWGGYDVILSPSGEYAKAKLLRVRPGHKLSLQRHHKRSEFWFVYKGVCDVYCSADVDDNNGWSGLINGESVYIPLGFWHRLVNPHPVLDLEVFEIQIGRCEEDDIERAADDFGRA